MAKWHKGEGGARRGSRRWTAPTGPTCTPQAAEEAAKSHKEKEKELMTGNPLLALGQEANFAIKRR